MAVSGTFPAELTEKVNNALKKGFKLHGSVSSFKDNAYGNSYTQALYREVAPAALAGGKRKTGVIESKKTLNNPSTKYPNEFLEQKPH